MNYTTLEKVKAALGAIETTDDAIIEEKIVEASRAIDRLCGAPDNYFMLEDVTGELCDGSITALGVIMAFPQKVVVNSVSSFEYRLSPKNDWRVVSSDGIAISNQRQVSAYGEAARQGRCFVRISYEGGYGEETPAVPAEDPDPRVPAVITGLHEDIINAATVLTVRFYREEKSGLTDAIGVAELGMMQYTKAMPARVVEMMKPYRRII